MSTNLDLQPVEGTGFDGDDQAIELPVSAIEHYSYCPRQCALIHIEQVFEENEFTMRGKLVHERVHSGDDTPVQGVPICRAMPLASLRLGLKGKADLVEFRENGPYPVEYKSGRRHGIHADLQLCAQALCLEEMLACEVPVGALYYFATRSRHEVKLDRSLRENTEAVIAAVRDMLTRQIVPLPVNDERCRDCSLRDACLPDVITNKARLRGLQSVMFQAYDPPPENEV
jgi:CRISPR-associated exonuclease Cas4